MMKIPIVFFCCIQLTYSISLHFPNSLQRFLYNDVTNTIVLASVNHLYSLNASDLSILADIDTSPSPSDHSCLLTNKSFSTPNLYYFSTSSYLIPSVNQTFNQLLLSANQSILVCSTANRGGSCQLRSFIDLSFIRNSSQRVVSSSPFYPSIGLINQQNQILYLSNTYDSVCDPFYEIPTISGRHVTANNFLSVIHFNSGQSALQQSTYTLRLLNIRLVKDFFLHYLYAFEYKHFSYFLTIQQSDIHHKHRLQTRILRFCQTFKQPIIKSYVEIPLTCGRNYHYLITAKFSSDKKVLYGLFRNTTLANLSSTSHALCAYSIVTIQEAFFQTIKRCLVDGKGQRGLGFLSPDGHCLSTKNLNDIDENYCPDENDSFFQYPIGGHRSIEQVHPIIELNDHVNFTSLEIASSRSNMTVVWLGDDNGTVHTFQTSDTNDVRKQNFQSKLIIDLKVIDTRATLEKAQLIVLTNDQIIKQNLSICDQYGTCNDCSDVALCHWCSKENRCTATFECVYERTKRKNAQIDMCTRIERVYPQTISLETSSTELQVNFNQLLQNDFDKYMCQFRVNDKTEFYRTEAVLNGTTIACLPPMLENPDQAVYNATLSIHHLQTNLTFGYYDLTLINCSNFLSCSSCTSYSTLCLWDHAKLSCLSEHHDKSSLSNRSHFIADSNQCSLMYLRQSSHRVPYKINQTLTIHIEQCLHSINITSCQLNDHLNRFSLIASNPLLTRSASDKNFCLLNCSFQWFSHRQSHQLVLQRPMKLGLSIQFSDKRSSLIPHTHISLYDCERMALNCTSCLQLDRVYGCTWCNNVCMFQNSSRKCPDNGKCVTPMIETVEPLLLPSKGGTIVNIRGKNFDFFNLSIVIADVICQVVEEESSRDRIVCLSGNARSTFHTGPVRLMFGSHGPQLTSRQIVSYINPEIKTIRPLVGIQNGGTLITIDGDNFTIGNNHVSVLIGNRPCRLVSITEKKIECETRLFPSSMLNENQPIQLLFDRHTKLIYEQSFTILPNPILDSFDKHHQYQSFRSGGHQLIITGKSFQTIQNIQLEVQDMFFLSPAFSNNTHIIFLTPSIEQLNWNIAQTIDITLYLDNFKRTSSLIYVSDPIVYELQPIAQAYTKELTVYGVNLTAIGHTTNEITVHIGCDLCRIVQLQSNRISCQPPRDRPKKYSQTKRLCYSSEQPTIIVTIDNIHTQVGFMIYPKKNIFILGVVSGCLFTTAVIVLIILLVICLKLRSTEEKYLQHYLYTNAVTPRHFEKETPCQSIDSSPSAILPIRSYLEYLQVGYRSIDISVNPPTHPISPELLDQFKFLIGTNDQFFNCLLRLANERNDTSVLNHLVLTRRYNLRKLFHLNHPTVHFSICILTSYDTFLINHIHSSLSQLYYQLKGKIQSGPIDAIEQTMSYYSLNIDSLIRHHSIVFKSIQLIVHIDSEKMVNVTCLTCDSISQVKEKILSYMHLYNQIASHDCQLYLLTNPSYSSSSSTASSSVPLLRKSLLTQVLFNRTIKYSTTTINDSYRDSNNLLLEDVDNTNEQTSHWRKFNTLQHYGILTDGYEVKITVPNKRIHSNDNTNDSKDTLRSSCHYCSLLPSNDQIKFHYLPSPWENELNSSSSDDKRYIHLLNHTYEEIADESGHLSIDRNSTETYRLLETKSIIHSVLINFIDTLFTNLLRSETFLNEMMEQDTEVAHIFYAHFIPFIVRNVNCLLAVTVDKYLTSSFDILAMIFQIACQRENSEEECFSCLESRNEKDYTRMVQNCTLVFADEIQRVRGYYLNLEQCLKNSNIFSEYSSTNTGIDRELELDDSIFHHLIEYSCLHADEIIEHLKANNQSLAMFRSLVQRYRPMGKT